MRILSTLVLVTTLAAILAWRAQGPLAQGYFHGVADDGSGIAVITRNWTGGRTLRLSAVQFNPTPLTSRIQVRLIAASDARDDVTVRDAVSLLLGDLDISTPSAEFRLPCDTDLRMFRAVSLWSPKDQRNLLTAPLELR